MATANSVPLDAPGVAAKRGEDPAVDGSHGREEGGGVKDNNDGKYHEGVYATTILPSSRARLTLESEILNKL